MPKSPATAVSLDPIAIGDISSKQAIDLVRQYAACHKRSGEALYSAFRRWTWRSLTERRYDDELRGWWEAMRMTAALLSEQRQSSQAERMRALCDLLYESIQFGLDESLEQVLGRVHVRRSLQLLKADWVERPRLRELLSLKEANLSRLLSLLQSRGLIERAQNGRIASFRLTRAGQEALKSLPSEHATAPAPPPTPNAVRMSPHHTGKSWVRSDARIGVSPNKRAIFQAYMRKRAQGMAAMATDIWDASSPLAATIIFDENIFFDTNANIATAAKIDFGVSRERLKVFAFNTKKYGLFRHVDLLSSEKIVDAVLRLEAKHVVGSAKRGYTPVSLVSDTKPDKIERRGSYSGYSKKPLQSEPVRKVVNG